MQQFMHTLSIFWTARKKTDSSAVALEFKLVFIRLDKNQRETNVG